MLRSLALAALFSIPFAQAAGLPGISAKAPFDDAGFDEKLAAAAEARANKNDFFHETDLTRADKVEKLDFAATKPSAVRLAGDELYRRSASSTLMLVAASKQDLEDEGLAKPAPDAPEKLASRRAAGAKARPGKRHRTSLGGATAFVVNSAEGVIVTCRHALEFEGPFVLAAVTAEGRVVRVNRILLADKTHDIAFLKIEATDLPALPVAPDIAAGEPVRVMAHPTGYYFHMTDGIVARHSLSDPDEEHPDAPRAPLLNITADIAEGSSGGAVLDACGNVVGVAQSYALAENDEQQTAFKHRGAIPSAAILAHLKAE